MIDRFGHCSRRQLYGEVLLVLLVVESRKTEHAGGVSRGRIAAKSLGQAAENLFGLILSKTFNPPNSLVQIDAAQTKIKKDWPNEFDRPIYFVDLRDSYMCSWCEIDGNQLVLIPSPQSRRPSKRVRYPGDADVVGRVTVVTMPLAETR